LGLAFIILILFALFFWGSLFIETDNLFIAEGLIPAIDWPALFLPYGVIIFSLWGVALIPEIEEILIGKKEKFLKIIPIAILIPALIYLFFIYIVLGIMGDGTEREALIGLKAVFGDGIGVIALFFGLLTTFTSFIALGLTLKKVFWYDFKLSKNLSWAIACFLPLLIFLIGVREFVTVISFVGAIMLAIDGILILLMYKKSIAGERVSKIKSLAVYPLILILLGGIVYAIVDLLYLS